MKFWFTFASLLALSAVADEGMWPVDTFPASDVKGRYGFLASREWLKHIQLSSALLNDGCSAGFVSNQGLVMTNHHCLLSCIEQLSSKKDSVIHGFYARTLDEEIKCPSAEISKLIEIKDVTKEVKRLTKDAKNFDSALGDALYKIRKACDQSDVERCKVHSFDFGKSYHLYRQRVYRDVRLVFAPEFATAYFGGYQDNYEFPRFGFDVAFLRIYENNKPVQTENFFKWSRKGAQKAELSFISGHPGYILRRAPAAELLYARDGGLAQNILDLAEQRGFLKSFQYRGEKQKRTSLNRLYVVENNLKGLTERQDFLRFSGIIERKLAAERALRSKINADPRLRKQYGRAFEVIEKSYKEYKASLREIRVIERLFSSSRPLSQARDVVRKNRQKSTGENKSIKDENSADDSVMDSEFEIAMLKQQLRKMREILGPDHSSVKRILGDKSPEKLAAHVINDASKNNLIRLAEVVDAEVQTLQSRFDGGVGEFVESAVEKVSRAYFLLGGESQVPEPKFTLRISFGTVKGIQKDRKLLEPLTTIREAFERHTGNDPYVLSDKWLNAKKILNLETPLNFIVAADVVGGNSGSPVLNRNAEVTGIVFDGNMHSIGGFYGYDSRSRAIALHSEAIIELLKKVYKADRITAELNRD